MTRIYLDVNDRVCVDRTSNAEHANRAQMVRGLLTLYARLGRTVHRASRLLDAAGESNRAASVRSTLRKINRAASDLRADAA
jgi:hypothetical protein